MAGVTVIRSEVNPIRMLAEQQAQREREEKVKTYTMDQVKAAVNRAMDVLDVDYEAVDDVVSFVERDLTGPYRAEPTLSNCGLYPDMPWRVVDTTERDRTVAVCLHSGIASIVADALNERAAKC